VWGKVTWGAGLSHIQLAQMMSGSALLEHQAVLYVKHYILLAVLCCYRSVFDQNFVMWTFENEHVVKNQHVMFKKKCAR